MPDERRIMGFSNGANPPLQKDANGNIRLLVVGNSGTGKSTMTKQLADMLSVPVLHLDQLHWKSNWTEAPNGEFREAVASFMIKNDNWVIDGDYNGVVGDLTTSNATNIIWLDPHFVLYFPRLILRTCLRLFRLNPPCSPDCVERLSEVLSWGKKSVLWWSWTHHIPQRVFYTGEMRRAERDNSNKWIRLGGWGGEVTTWLDRVKNFVRGR